KVRIESGKAVRDVNVTLALPPENPPRETQTISGRNPLGGAKVENLSPAAAVDLQMDLLARGVVIVAVSPNSFAQAQGFRPGDIIRSVNGAAVNRVGDLARGLNGVGRWDMIVERNGQRMTVSVEG
ncbi:MAG TPA: PDZ domain-containing protein, partial [Rhizomicrobium sp.]|nr:PDZ domain-containing protein [Rhizomicrobium sp.]